MMTMYNLLKDKSGNRVLCSGNGLLQRDVGVIKHLSTYLKYTHFDKNAILYVMTFQSFISPLMWQICNLIEKYVF